MTFDCDRRIDAILTEDKLCKHLDGDLTYCLMIKSKCVGRGYCRDFEEREQEDYKNMPLKDIVNRIQFCADRITELKQERSV